jgi:hypothetical protein
MKGQTRRTMAPPPSGLDVAALAFLLDGPPGAWFPTPPCFRPTALCMDQVRRGLIEMIVGRDGTSLRLTPDGRKALTIWLAEHDD